MHKPSRKFISMALSGLILVASLALLIGSGGLLGAHAQDQVTTTPEAIVVEKGPDMSLVPNDFMKRLPTNGATISGTSVVLEWYKPGPTSSANPMNNYHCVDKTNDGICDSNLWVYNDDQNRGLANLEPGSTYYWQIQACNLDGCKSANYNEWWSFTVPPQIFGSVAVQDGWILESAQGSGAGGTVNSTASYLTVGDDASNRQYRSFLSFDTSSIPDNADISSVKIRLYLYTPSSNGPFAALGNLTASIRRPYFGASSVLTSTDFNAAASMNNVAQFGSTPVNGWYTASLTSGQLLVNPYGLTQFRLAFSTPTNGNNAINLIKFYSGESTYKPQLVITYTVP